MNGRQKLAQIRHAAALHYEQRLSQQEISRILGRSHSTVSRLLAEARELGIVEFRVNRPVADVPELAAELRGRFGLRDAVVAPGGGSVELARRNVGLAGAEFLTRVIGDGMRVGITWGRTLAEVVRAMEPLPLEGVEVVQMAGSLGFGVSEEDGPGPAVRLAALLDASCRLIPAPAVVDSEEARNLFLRQPQIRDALARARRVDVAIQGIGSLSSGTSSLRRAGYLTREERTAARAAGAVGHVSARMIDVAGREVGGFSKRVIGVPLEDLRGVRWSIGVGASPDKAPAVLGALRGGCFNAVVIDEDSARDVLELDRAAAARGSAAA